MTYLKKYGLRYFFTIIYILILMFILTICYHYNLIDTNTYNVLRIITLLVIILFNSTILGKNTIKKGYLTGLIFGLTITVILAIINIILGSFKIKCILYYILIIATSSLGSIIGINLNKKK